MIAKRRNRGTADYDSSAVIDLDSPIIITEEEKRAASLVIAGIDGTTEGTRELMYALGLIEES